MKNEEKIRKYLEGELSGEELINFEKEIDNSPELKKEIESYRNTLDQFAELKETNSSGEYFESIVPRFRKSKPNHFRFNPSFAFGSAVIVMIALIIFFIFSNKKGIVENADITLQQLDNEELETYLNDRSQDLAASQLTENVPDEYDSLLATLIADELSVNGFTRDYLVDITNSEVYNLINELSDEDIEYVYNNLIKERF